MNIQEAVRKAIAENALIYRKGNRWIGNRTRSVRIAIQPTSSYETCIVRRFDNGEETKRHVHWNPTADDLTADDWELMQWPDNK